MVSIHAITHQRTMDYQLTIQISCSLYEGRGRCPAWIRGGVQSQSQQQGAVSVLPRDDRSSRKAYATVAENRELRGPFTLRGII